MPLPIIAVALAWLIEAGIQLLAYYIRALLVSAAVEYVWPLVKAKIIDWARDVMPRLVIEVIRQVVGLDVHWPLSPAELTRAINQRIGAEIFTDVTDELKVRDDLFRYALEELRAVLPGVNLKPEDFNKSPSARARLARKLRVAAELHVIAALEAGESALVPAPVVARIMELARTGYEFTPHVNKDTVYNAVGRESAAWWRRHATRIRERT